MEKTSVISVLGCGWLGFPLAVRLAGNGFFVRGSTTSIEKLEVLTEHKIDPFLVQLGSKDGKLDEAFFRSDILIVNIPPKGNPEMYLMQMQEVQKLILKNKIRKVVFISSTSVYGEECSAVDEDTVPKPETASGKAVLDAERIFRNNPAFDACIIRMGGLIGPGRHPGRFFSGKKDIPNGNAPVNLIHLDDCIGIIEAVLGKNAWNMVFNACSPQHPSRQEFYTAMAKVAGLPLPLFKNELLKWKIIMSKNLAVMDYKFKRVLGQEIGF